MRIAVIIFLCIICQGVYAQTSIKKEALQGKALKLYNEGLKLSKSGKTKEAEKKFDKLIKDFPSFLEAKLWKAGLAFDNKNYSTCIDLIDQVIKKDSTYNADMYYAIALSEFRIKTFDQAANHYERYLAMSPTLNEQKKNQIKRDITTCRFRDQAYKHPQPFSPKQLDGLINTPDLEYLPSLTIDGSKMIFTRRSGGLEALFMSAKKDNDWGVATPMDEFNATNNVGAHTISADGKMIIFTSCENKLTGYGSCDLYRSTLENGKWTKPANMGNKVNTSSWESQPCLSDNGKILLFASDRKGGLGGYDIWMIKRGKDGRWLNAENLGPNINTPGNEESPFLHADGKSLYFRSNGHIGMGSADLYLSKFDIDKKTWTEAVNLGYPINTEGDEGALYVDAKGSIAYYSSDIDSKRQGKAHLDIYTFDLPSALRPQPTTYIKIKVADAQNKMAIDAKYSIIDLATSDTISQGNTLDSQLLISLGQGKNYGLWVSKSKYNIYSENFNTEEFYDPNKPIEKNIFLRAIEEKQQAPIVLNNIFFETGSAILLATSTTEIEGLVRYLNDQKSIRIHILGHTDNIGDDNSNLLLSTTRAKAVYNALIQKGIDIGRLSYEGKGESSPIADNNTSEGRKANRRTEFIIIL